MNTNYTNNTNQKETSLIYPELSYIISGVCFNTHNELGRFAREKQYADNLEKRLIEIELPYEREFAIGDSGNIVDFLIDAKVILELKAKRMLITDDYYQIQRYLQFTRLKLGLLVNFRSQYLRPARIVRIDTDKKHNYSQKKIGKYSYY